MPLFLQQIQNSVAIKAHAKPPKEVQKMFGANKQEGPKIDILDNSVQSQSKSTVPAASNPNLLSVMHSASP